MEQIHQFSHKRSSPQRRAINNRTRRATASSPQSFPAALPRASIISSKTALMREIWEFTDRSKAITSWVFRSWIIHESLFEGCWAFPEKQHNCATFVASKTRAGNSTGNRRCRLGFSRGWATAPQRHPVANRQNTRFACWILYFGLNILSWQQHFQKQNVS